MVQKQRFLTPGGRDELQAELDHLKSARRPDVSARIHAKGTVQFGSLVTVITEKGKRQKYQLVGSAEAKPLEGKISNESPVGQALLEHKVGDVVEVTTPAGVTKLKISKVT